MLTLAQDAAGMPWAKLGDSIVGLLAIAMVVAFLAYLKTRDKADREAEIARAARYKELGEACHDFQAEQMKQLLDSRGRLADVIDRNTAEIARNTAHLTRAEARAEREAARGKAVG